MARRVRQRTNNDQNDIAGMVAAIGEMVNVIKEMNENYRGRQHGNEGDRLMLIQGEFRKTRPPVFKGEPDPMVAEEWLRQIKRRMANQGVPEDLMVSIACTYLEGQAYHWWESVFCTPNAEISTWVEFEKIFLDKYFPCTLRHQKSKEFSTLLQMAMSVGVYQAKFEELMRFAPELVPDDFAKARRFEDGLRPSIREKVVILKLQRYADVVDRALIAERSINETNGVCNNKHGGPSPSNKFQTFELSEPQRPRVLGTISDTRMCYQCKKVGHIRENCPKSKTLSDARLCYQCKKVGHIRENCPQLRNTRLLKHRRM